MTLVLGFDTSAAHCAAALVSGDTVLASASEAMTKGQAERLIPMLSELLEQAGKDWSDLDRLAVCTGPGNFTGVRIGVAAARGLALSLGIPALGVTGFAALAYGHSGPLTVVLDGRRGQFFTQDFLDGAETGKPANAAVAQVSHAKPVLGFMADELAKAAGSRSLGENTQVDPVALARIAAAKPVTGERPAPLYLRAADAALPADPPPVILP